MKRTLIATMAVLFAAAGANALSLTIDSDAASYTVGQTITITATLDTAGAPAGNLVDVTLTWDGALAHALNSTATFTLGSSSQIITAGTNVGNSNLTSFGGGLPWTGPPQSGCVLSGGGAGNTCIILNQAQLSGSFVPDSSILVGTLQLQADATGSLALNAATVNAFGVVATIGSNFSSAAVVVPEPTTAALLGLGLLGLGIAGRRR